MDINLPQLFRGEQAALYLPIRRQPVNQDAGEKAGAAAFYPEYQKSTADSGRKDSAQAY